MIDRLIDAGMALPMWGAWILVVLVAISFPCAIHFAVYRVYPWWRCEICGSLFGFDKHEHDDLRTWPELQGPLADLPRPEWANGHWMAGWMSCEPRARVEERIDA